MSAPAISAYFAKIGSKGGKKSRRVLTTEQAKVMAQLSLESKRSKAAKRPRKQTKGK
jgi:hypothetical protein